LSAKFQPTFLKLHEYSANPDISRIFVLSANRNLKKNRLRGLIPGAPRVATSMVMTDEGSGDRSWSVWFDGDQMLSGRRSRRGLLRETERRRRSVELQAETTHRAVHRPSNHCHQRLQGGNKCIAAFTHIVAEKPNFFGNGF